MSEIRSVASFRGSFKQGIIADLLIKITDFDGTPIDPSSIEVVIEGPLETTSSNMVITTSGPEVTDSSTPFQITEGYYVYSWDVAADQAVGNYNVTWTYIVDGDEKNEFQIVTVVESQTNAEPSSFYTQRLIDFREALEYHLSCAQTIPVYNEQARPSRDNTTFEFSFPDWNQSSGVKIYRNEVIVNADAEVDYFKGNVTFDSQLLPQETVNADYNFKWFSEEQLTRFLVNALQTVNTFPPHTGYTLDDVPDRYFPAILYGAAKDAIRQLMGCLMFQQPAQIFGGTEEAQKAFGNFETLKQNYEKDWEKLVDQKKFGPYPRLRLNVTPEYTLPGGRSIVSYSQVFIKVDNQILRATMKELFDIFRNNYYKNIEILSQDNNGSLIYAPINYVWNSGTKSVYELKTTNGYDIRSSYEHLFYVNNKYLPLMDIKIGDKILTCDNNKIETTTVKSINRLRRKEKMYDLEVGITANLFVNGIKCHNSRWFRYLFKG